MDGTRRAPLALRASSWPRVRLRGTVAVAGVLSLVASTASVATAAAAPAEEAQSSPAGSAHGGLAAEPTNVALRRPCRPSPLCVALVDGSNNLTTQPVRRGRQHLERGNGTGIEPGDGLALSGVSAGRETFSSGEHALHNFKVFLSRKFTVTQVIIFCVAARSGSNNTSGPHRRKLVVTTWMSSGLMDKSTEQGSIEDGSPMTGERSLSAVAPEKRWEQEVTVDASSFSEGAEMRFVFSINDVATAVAVEWVALPPADGGCGECVGLQITEVEVMGLPVGTLHEGEDANGQRSAQLWPAQNRQGRSLVAMNSPPSTSNRAGRGAPVVAASAAPRRPPLELLTKGPSERGEGVGPRTAPPQAPQAGAAASTSIAAHVQGSAVGSKTMYSSALMGTAAGKNAGLAARKPRTTESPTTLSPDPSSVAARAGPAAADSSVHGEALAQVELVSQQGFLARSPATAFPPATEGDFGGMPILTWLAIMTVTAMFIPRCFLATKGLPGFAYDRLPEAEPEVPSVATEVGTDWLFDEAGTVAASTTTAVTIGAAATEASAPQFFHIGSPDGSRSTSPAPLQRTQSSETEPEHEPFSDTGSACSRAGSPGSRALVQLRALPSPVALGCHQPAFASAAPAPRQPRGRVVLLYASPLCYRDMARRPTPMPQIPFEREWDTMVQAYDEAAVALREASCCAPPRSQGSSRPQWRKPGAALAAQPLTAGSLQRTVAPVAASGVASVVHLSAHGVRDCLVLEDGQGTAHLLSCEMLRRMLDLHSEPASPATAGLRLVILNACSLQAIGAQFVQGGVPHVICSSADLRDSASHVFLRSLYSNLFQGSSIARAFDAACVALRSDSEATTRAAADHFVLLPQGSAHHEVLFQPEWSIASSMEATAPANSVALPAGHSAAARSRLSFTGFSDGTLTARTTTAEGTGSSTEGLEESGCSDGPHSSAESSSLGGRHGDTTSSSDSDESGHFCDGAGSPEEARLLPPARADAGAGAGARAGREARARARLAGGSGAETPAAAAAARRRTARSEGLTGRFTKPLLRRSSCASAAPAAPAALPTPFGRVVPPVPEDFLGRALDTWSVLQHLGSRRAVVVCGAPGEEHGVGKSAVLDAVHRAFALQMGGMCVAVQLQSLSHADAAAVGAGGWIEKVTSAVQQAAFECRELWWPAGGGGAGPRPAARTFSAPRPSLGGSGALRRRPLRGGSSRVSTSRSVSCGFHALSDPITVEAALTELITEMATLSDLCEARCREWPAACSRILLLLDECDHLIQQQHFQDAVADVLQHCSAYQVVLSTHQRMVGTAGGRFKVVHHPIEGLSAPDAARLFLRRAQRPLRWGELLSGQSGSLAGGGGGGPAAAVAAAVGATQDPRSPVVIRRENEAAVLGLVAAHPSVAAQRGNPRRLIELASRLGSTQCLLDLAPAQEQQVKKSEILSVQGCAGLAGDAAHDGELAPLLGRPSGLGLGPSVPSTMAAGGALRVGHTLDDSAVAVRA